MAMALSRAARKKLLPVVLPALSASTRGGGGGQTSNVNAKDKVGRIAHYHVSSGGSMRGLIFWEPNKPLTLEEFHIPCPKAGELLIKTKACGVCQSDLHVIKGELPFASPCAIGHEITGEVVEHGPRRTEKSLLEELQVTTGTAGNLKPNGFITVQSGNDSSPDPEDSDSQPEILIGTVQVPLSGFVNSVRIIDKGE